MSDRFEFVRFKESVETSLADVGQAGYTMLLGMGIVNPFGPTLNIVAADGFFATMQGRVPIIHMMLNPFAQECHTVGEVNAVGDGWAPLTDLEPFFSLPFGSCPTVLLQSCFMTTELAQSVYAELLTTFEDGASVLARVREHPGDPWNRVQAEVDRTVESRMGRKALEHGALNDEEALELAVTQLTPKNVAAELQAFFFAWRGAIEFQGGGHMARTAMPLETLMETFAALSLSCTLPSKPE